MSSFQITQQAGPPSQTACERGAVGGRSPSGTPAAHLSARLFKSIDEEGRRQRAVKPRDLEQAGRCGLVLSGMGLAPAGDGGVSDGAQDRRLVRLHGGTYPRNGEAVTFQRFAKMNGAAS